MTSSSASRSKVVVVDVQAPFMSTVTFMVKWQLAPIPALVILAVIAAALAVAFAGLFSGLASN